MLGLDPCSVLGQVHETPVWWDFAGCSHLLCGHGEAEGFVHVARSPLLLKCHFAPSNQKGKCGAEPSERAFPLDASPRLPLY